MTAASAERWFPKRNIIKNSRKSKIGQERLTWLSIFSNEIENAEKLREHVFYVEGNDNREIYEQKVYKLEQSNIIEVSLYITQIGIKWRPCQDTSGKTRLTVIFHL